MLSIFILIMVIVALGAGSTIVMKKKQETAGTNKFFSVDSMTEKLLLLGKRFPISILLVVGLVVLFFIAINGDFDDISFKLWIFFSVSIFISITVTLFVEDFLTYLKTYAVSLFAVLLWGVYCFFLPEEADDMLINKIIELSVIGTAAFLAMLFISFLKNNTDRPFWNFSTHTLFQMVLACFFGAILFGGLSLALFAIDSLFNISITDKIYGNLAVICFALFTPVYFLANIPNKTEKQKDEIFYTKIQKILALYILTPILAVYAIILYAYLFKIIIAWELPDGWVSWLVSALALGGLLVIALLYPIREQEDNKAVAFISRWFGLLILPLLALMTIGIFRRIGDYGITINRAYILLLNLWFYGIYIYLFLFQSRHVKWILISPVVIALLTSISFWGVANLSKNSLSKEISAVLNEKVSSEEAKLIFAEMTQDEKERIESTLDYLYRNFGKESVQVFFTDTVSDNRWTFLSELGLDFRHYELDGDIENISYYANEKVWTIENYNTFASLNYYKSDDANDTIKISVDSNTFEIPIKEIALEYSNARKKMQDEWDWVIRGNDYTILINNFHAYCYKANDSISIDYLDGYLFCEMNEK